LSQTFYWHDYETWGADPRRDRPCQFAGVRTDADLNEIEEPVVLYCQPPLDQLPHPEAVLVTGITPQSAAREGLREAGFATAIHRLLSEPGTCGVGYNSLHFDDDVSRHLFYRNLIDPYGREWRNGNSRWDLIDVLRLAHALRPEGLEWPRREDGTASFKLEHLSLANGIEHAQAHDALADVRATIALARRLKQAQPRLFDFALKLRDKREARALLDRGQPLLHVSARYPAALGCIAPVFPVAPHPTNSNAVICFDLRADPAQLLDLPLDVLRARLFTPREQRAEDAERVPLKGVHLNRAPMLAPMGTLDAAMAERWRIDPAQAERHAAVIRASAPAIAERVRALFSSEPPPETDPELQLYSGPFLSDQDRRTLDQLRQLAPEALAAARPVFQDNRLPTLLFRYRARNWPETLSPDERDEWEAWRLHRLTDPEGGATLVLEDFEARLMALGEQYQDDPTRLRLLESLSDWAEQLLDADL